MSLYKKYDVITFEDNSKVLVIEDFSVENSEYIITMNYSIDMLNNDQNIETYSIFKPYLENQALERVIGPCSFEKLIQEYRSIINAV